jgi:hypothetical protein
MYIALRKHYGKKATTQNPFEVTKEVIPLKSSSELKKKRF